MVTAALDDLPECSSSGIGKKKSRRADCRCAAQLKHPPCSPAPALPLSCPQPCFVFVGDVFENDPAMRQVKSLLLDYFRGRQVGAAGQVSRLFLALQCQQAFVWLLF